jgi:trk system potassium uptake protein TrkA
MAARNKILIIGIGRLGAMLANRASQRGENVIVVDPQETAFERLDDTFTGFKITGDATDIRTLESDCYITSVYEVIITTGDDNTNLFLAHLCAKIYGVPQVFVRFDDPDKSVLISGIPSIQAIYPSDLSAKRFIALEAEGEK